MKVVLVDCLIYQGLLYRQRRRAAGSPDRDEPITTRMKRAQGTGPAADSNGNSNSSRQRLPAATDGSA
jgi:hypothetical protein